MTERFSGHDRIKLGVRESHQEGLQVVGGDILVNNPRAEEVVLEQVKQYTELHENTNQNLCSEAKGRPKGKFTALNLSLEKRKVPNHNLSSRFKSLEK